MDRRLQRVSSAAMNDIVELVCEYRTLAHRAGRNDRPLNPAERRRLGGLERLLGREPDDGPGGDLASGTVDLGRRRFARCDVRLVAGLSVLGRAIAVRVVDLGAGGVRIVSEEPIPSGERGVLRIAVPDSGRIYAFAVEVSWAIGEGGGSIPQPVAGLRFRGAPREIALAS
jgi:PilZ domain